MDHLQLQRELAKLDPLQKLLFRQKLLRNATAFSAMARSGMDIGSKGRQLLDIAKRMGLTEAMTKGLPTSFEGVPIRGQERTGQLLDRFAPLFRGEVKNVKQALGVPPKLPPNTPDISLSQRQVDFPSLRNPRIGTERSAFRGGNDILGLGLDEDFE